MADIEREWVIPNSFVNDGAEQVDRGEAIRLLSKRLLLPGPLDGSNPISDLIDIIPPQLWTESTLATLDLSPFLAALREATADGVGKVNGVVVGGGHEGTKFSTESYAEGLDIIAGKDTTGDAVKSAVMNKYPNISAADLASVVAEVQASVAADRTVSTVKQFEGDWAPVVDRVTGDRTYGGAVTVNAEGEATETPTTPAGDTGAFSIDDLELDGETRPQGMTEADMRNAFSTDDLTWDQIRQAVASGSAAPGVMFGVDPTMGFAAPTGAVDTRRSVSLLDAAEEINLRSPAERKAIQKRMQDAGYFRSEYRPGINDAATKQAWTQVISDAWYERKTVTQVLAERANAVEQAKLEALDRAKRQTSTDQLSVDDGRFRFMADNMARKVLGRELTDAEMVSLRADMLAYEQERTTKALDRSFGAGGELQTAGPLAESEIDANVADWMRENQADEATWVESYSRLFTVMNTLGIETKMPNLSTEEMQMYGAQAAANKWTPDRMFLQILVNAMDGANA